MSDKPGRDAKVIFLAAIENRTPDEWDAYVDEACGNDAALRGHVAALLRAHREKDNGPDDATLPLHRSLRELSRVSLADAGGDESPLATSTGRGTGECPPERVGRYRIKGEIARGGVGAVFKAHDDDLGRSLAVKILLDDHRHDPEMLQRFLEEAQISGQLQHPGIVPIHDIGLSADERPYFTMKLVKGQTLAKVLDTRENPARDRQRFLGIFEKICETIAYAHARGVIHRDLKPSNVMIGSFGEVQVVDWGLAKVLARGRSPVEHEADSETGRTAIATVRSGSTVSSSLAGSVLGTPAYMSPEQARGELDELDERSDVFGLGAVLCEILTGKPPYVAATTRELLSQAKKGCLEEAIARIDGCGADRQIVDLAKRCLAFEARDRPRDAGAVVKEARDYLESLEERARSMKIRAAKARMRVTLALTMFIALSLGTGATVWLAEERGERADQARRVIAGMVSEAWELKAAAEAGDPTDAMAWSRALLATGRADPLITTDVDEDTHRQFEKLKAEVEAGHKQSVFLSRREDLRDIPLEFDWDALAQLDSEYARAFIEFLGRDLEALALEDGAELIRASSISRELVDALREWTMVRYMRTLPTGDWDKLADRHLETKLVQLYDRVNQSPTRHQARAYGMTMSRLNVADQVFVDFVNAESTSGLLLLARAVSLRHDYTAGEFLLRTALRREPGSYRVIYDLGRVLQNQGKYDEALRLALAARSLRPDRPWAWWLLGTVLEEMRDGDGALEAYTQAAILRPSEATFYRQLRGLAEPEDRPGFGNDMLERSLSSLEQLMASEAPVPTEARAALDVLLYDSITRSLNEPESLIGEGAVWRYRAAPEEPSPGLEWTTTEFDDSAWLEGKSGFGYGDGDDATILDDMQGNYARVCVRRALDLPDPARFERLELSLRVDDGCVVYLNGQLLARLRVSPEGIVQNAPEPVAEAVFEIPLENLSEGTNLIAIEGFNQPVTSSDFSLIPVVRGELSPEAARDRDRELLEAFRGRVSGSFAEARAAYFEGQVLRRAGRHDDAGGKLTEASRADPDSVLLPYALAECLLEAGHLERRDSELRDLFARSVSLSGRFRDTGVRTALVVGDWTPAEILAVLPPREASSDWNEIRWFLERLRDGETVRINCGGKRYVSASGAVWDRDEFFSGGGLLFGGNRDFEGDIRGTEDDPIYATERWFAAPPAPPGAYRVPLPAGDYRVTLHFAEVYPPSSERRAFDVLIEGKRVLASYRPAERAGIATADVRSFDVHVDDRVLDIEFVRRVDNPKISGIEFQKID